MDLKEILTRLSVVPGVSGAEGSAAAAAAEILAPLGPCENTPLGSLICRVKPVKEGKAHLLLTAHLDQIGLVVTKVGDDGFLRIGPCGGVDRSTLWAAPVTVHSESGPIHGVVCTLPPHAGQDESKLPKVEDLYIDVGYDGPQAKHFISPGDRVTLTHTPRMFGESLFCGGVTDDRAGCAAVIYASQLLAAEALDCGLSVLLASMEEVGSQGARTGGTSLSPTHAVAVDVTFGLTPDAPSHKCGKVGEGPMIGFSPILDRRCSARMHQLAKVMKIPFQTEVMGGNTGTDADALAVTGAGVITALLSIPQKYMHTPAEIVSLKDIRATADLIRAYAIDLFGGDGHAL